MNFRKFILFLLLIPLNLNAQDMTKKVTNDSSFQHLSPSDAKQNLLILKLDSTITHLKNENTHLKELAEQDIDHAKSLINMTETIVEFIAVLLAIFTVVGGFIIAKMFRQSSQISKDHKVLLEDWEKTRREIDELKESSIREGKELLQILFYITEGDNQIKNNPEEAINLYKKALAIKENNPEVYVKLGYANVEIGKYDDAISFLQKGVNLDSQNISILHGLARAYRKAMQFDKAEIYYKKAFDLDNNNIWVLSGLGQIYLQKKDFKNAEIIYKKVMSMDNSFHPIFNLAFVYFCKQDMKNAEYYFEEAIKLIDERLIRRPDSRWALRLKAISFIGLSKYDEAKKILLYLKETGIYPPHVRSIIDRLKILHDLYGDKRLKEMMSIFKEN